ncbi:hypothetical protein [Sodalis-like endosymbiont of Proechinophthirus fluctus]|uniref:hypothetical protein n=1 Tax=Sodalis-like endosymbiont of Proechinophthirus fluctus TaxID=1462730 RepID=UPI00164F02F3|nr:hypothetical protein [Sodalis-like endosymbiont of Proechinophthirus fluctus]
MADLLRQPYVVFLPAPMYRESDAWSIMFCPALGLLLDLADDTIPDRYRAALLTFMGNKDYYALLIIYVPSATSPSNQTAT